MIACDCAVFDCGSSSSALPQETAAALSQADSASLDFEMCSLPCLWFVVSFLLLHGRLKLSDVSVLAQSRSPLGAVYWECRTAGRVVASVLMATAWTCNTDSGCL
jgi:hypothetical protein